VARRGWKESALQEEGVVYLFSYRGKFIYIGYHIPKLFPGRITRGTTGNSCIHESKLTEFLEL
jgi:hypothetical protein